MLFTEIMVVWFGVTMVLIVVLAHLVEFLDKRSEDRVIRNATYIPETIAIDHLESRNISFREFYRPDPMLEAPPTKLSRRSSSALRYSLLRRARREVRIVRAEFYLLPVAFGIQLDNPLCRKENHAPWSRCARTASIGRSTASASECSSSRSERG